MSTMAKTILVADDDRTICFILKTALTRGGFVVETFSTSQDLLTCAAQGQGDLVITDIVMPSGSGLDLLKTLKNLRPELPVIVITAQSTLGNAVRAFEHGAFEYLPKPFDINKVVELVCRALEKDTVAHPHRRWLDVDRFGGIVGSSKAMQELFHTIGRMAHSEMTTLINGESGTGKELVAQAIHAHSPRRNGPFTAINMAAIPKNLIESELFGHEKGAFTGATSRRPGHFERTRAGTLFLDEIGDMPMEAQTRLLRVLQDGTFNRVGGAETLWADVRIIAATHQNLPDAIATGRFREDLFYRLNVVPLHVPSLRSRPEDIPLLADFFLAQVAKKIHATPKRFSPEALDLLINHDWPGNVRELENLIQRLMVLVPHDVILPDRLTLLAATSGPNNRSLPQMVSPESDASSLSNHGPSLADAVVHLVNQHFSSPEGENTTNLYDLVVHQVETTLLDRVLQETLGNQVKAAQVLGINRNTLRKKILDLGIKIK